MKRLAFALGFLLIAGTIGSAAIAHAQEAPYVHRIGFHNPDRFADAHPRAAARWHRFGRADRYLDRHPRASRRFVRNHPHTPLAAEQRHDWRQGHR